MQPNKTLFFVIIGLALVAVAGMFAFVFLFQDEVPNLAPLQQHTEIEVVAAPSIEPWVSEAARTFNDSQANVTVRVSPATELIPSAKLRSAAAWIPEATFVAEIATREGYTVNTQGSVAATALAWGTYIDKLDAFRRDYGELTWDNLHAKATGPDGLKLVINSPQNTGAGLAALALATAAHANTNQITARDVGTADSWLTETLGNNNAQPRSKPAETLASVQGRSIADLALLPQAAWRQVKLDQSDQFTILPTEPAVGLDYPFVIVVTTPEAETAASSFQQFLLQPDQQNKLIGAGFDLAGTAPGTLQLDGEAAQRLLNWADRVLR